MHKKKKITHEPFIDCNEKGLTITCTSCQFREKVVILKNPKWLENEDILNEVSSSLARSWNEHHYKILNGGL